MFRKFIYQCAVVMVSASTLFRTTTPVSYNSDPAASSVRTSPYGLHAHIIKTSANRIAVKARPVISYPTIPNRRAPVYKAIVVKTPAVPGYYATKCSAPLPFAPLTTKPYQSIHVPMAYHEVFRLKLNTALAKPSRRYSSSPVFTYSGSHITSKSYRPIPVPVEYTDSSTDIGSTSPFFTESYQFQSAQQELHHRLRPYSGNSETGTSLADPHYSAATYTDMPAAQAYSSTLPKARTSTVLAPSISSMVYTANPVVTQTVAIPVKTKSAVPYSSAADVSHVSYNGMGISFGW